MPTESRTDDPDAGTEIDVTLFIACYNEAKHIEATLDTVLAAVDEVGCSYEVIVIDDASADGSPALVEAYQHAHPHRPIRLLVNDRNQGLDRNLITAARLGRGRFYRLICGDDVEPRETIAEILRYLGKADVVIPYHERCEGKSLFRRILSRAYTLLINAISGHHIRYYNGMALHLRRDVLRWYTARRGFGVQADLILRALDHGAAYIEVPVRARHRAEGASSALAFRNFVSVARMAVELGVRRLRRLA